ncbi:hypothetical protein [Rhizobium sp. R634]|uniref:hypothetical protein n=1 Tax=Rhizobium sp. R634 TaxID=1764274 RepID=UPI001130C5C7|nr:hypothetical protein [Rhizobium sp. R634]
MFFSIRSLKVLDVIAALLLVLEIVYIWKNVHFYTNWELYNIYTTGHYRNFKKIGENDKMFVAVNKMINCNEATMGKADRIDIATSSVFFIQTAMFLEVSFKKTENGQCIDQMMFRSMPG